MSNLCWQPLGQMWNEFDRAHEMNRFLRYIDQPAGSMVIDPKVADQLGLPKLGEVLTVGIGGKATASFRQGKRFELGPLKLRNPVYIELDLSFLEPIFGRKIGGVVGYDVLARCVAEVETGTPFIDNFSKQTALATGTSGVRDSIFPQPFFHEESATREANGKRGVNLFQRAFKIEEQRLTLPVW